MINEFELEIENEETFELEETTGGGGGASTWNEIINKPFNTIGDNLKVENGALKVDTVNEAAEDNTKPITSSGVHTIVGNIDIILSRI